MEPEDKSHEENWRPDKHVIRKDLQHVLGDERFKEFIHPVDEQRLGDVFSDARAYVGLVHDGSMVDPREHQSVADRIMGHAIVSLVEENADRQTPLKRMIKHATCTAHTNYQFIRVFLRRNLPRLLKSHKVELSEFPDFFPDHVIEQLNDKRFWKKWLEAYCTVGEYVKPYAQPILYVLAGLKILQLASDLDLVASFFKGEFTHSKEVMPVLKALSAKGIQVRIGLVVAKPNRFEELSKEIRDDRATNIVLGHIDSKLFRYYVFPSEYVLMISGARGQFLVFWGDTQNKEAGALDLVKHDWHVINDKGKICIAD